MKSVIGVVVMLVGLAVWARATEPIGMGIGGLIVAVGYLGFGVHRFAWRWLVKMR